MILTDEMVTVWSIISRNIKSKNGVAGLMGNLYAESGCRADNLQNSYAKRLGMTDEQYTAAVNDRSYLDFAGDRAGYGLAQWTSKARKQNLYGFAACYGRGIGDAEMQTVFLLLEIQNYSAVYGILQVATSVYGAADAVLRMYEKPRNVTQEKAAKRTQDGTAILDAMRTLRTDGPDILVPEYHVMKRGAKGDKVKHLQEQLLNMGYLLPRYGADGKYGRETANAVRKFQEYCRLYEDGVAGSVTQWCMEELSL